MSVFRHSPHYPLTFFSERKNKKMGWGYEGGIFFFCAHKNRRGEWGEWGVSLVTLCQTKGYFPGTP